MRFFSSSPSVWPWASALLPSIRGAPHRAPPAQAGTTPMVLPPQAGSRGYPFPFIPPLSQFFPLFPPQSTPFPPAFPHFFPFSLSFPPKSQAPGLCLHHLPPQVLLLCPPHPNPLFSPGEGRQPPAAPAWAGGMLGGPQGMLVLVPG